MPGEPVSPERWHRLETLFVELSQLSDDERRSRLADVAAPDRDLVPVLERMLHAESSASGRIAGAIAGTAGAVVMPSSWIGRRFGPYAIVREIGRGGMGLVFEAVRADDEYRKRVALKIAPDWRGSTELHDRFRAERQILADLESEHIARFFDGGTEDGIPYFAMELVDGEPITQYCDRVAAPLAARVSLFRQVCAAVEYAHARLVVHRDLKSGWTSVGSK